MKKQKIIKEEQISLELPDYSKEYEEYMKKKKIDSNKQEYDNVIVIDLF